MGGGPVDARLSATARRHDRREMGHGRLGRERVNFKWSMDIRVGTHSGHKSAITAFSKRARDGKLSLQRAQCLRMPLVETKTRRLPALPDQKGLRSPGRSSRWPPDD